MSRGESEAESPFCPKPLTLIPKSFKREGVGLMQKIGLTGMNRKEAHSDAQNQTIRLISSSERKGRKTKGIKDKMKIRGKTANNEEEHAWHSKNTPLKTSDRCHRVSASPKLTSLHKGFL